MPLFLYVCAAAQLSSPPLWFLSQRSKCEVINDWERGESYVIPENVVLGFRLEGLLMLHTYLSHDVSTAHSAALPPLLSLLIIHSSILPPPPTFSAALSPPACLHTPRSTLSSGLHGDRNRRRTAECRRCSRCMCVRSYVWAWLNAFRWSWAAPRTKWSVSF